MTWRALPAALLVDRVRAGHSSALNVVDVERGSVERGDVVASPDVFEPGDLWEVALRALGPSRLPLRSRSTVRVHVGTAEVMGEVVLLEADALERGGAGLAQLRLQRAIVAAPGDRFVLRRHSPVETVGGGVVLGRSRWRLKARRPEVLDRLRRREAALGSLDELALLELEAHEGRGQDVPTPAAQVARALGCARAEVDACLRALAERGRVVLVGDQGYLTRPSAERRESSLAAARARVVETLTELHRARPTRPGFALPELRQGLPDLPEATLTAALEQLTAGAAARVRVLGGGGPSLLRLAEHAPHLPPREQRVAAAALATYRDQGLHAPPREQVVAQVLELATTARVADDVLDHLLAGERLVDLGDGLLVERGAFDRAVEGVKRRLAQGAATVSELREELGASRRHAVALLELLDRQRVTRREGNVRTLVKGATE